MSLERVWRCDVYRAGRRRASRVAAASGESFGSLRKLLGALNRKHTGILRLEEALLAQGGAGRVIANSRMVKNEIVKFTIIPTRQIDLIYNGVPLEIFSNAETSGASNAEKLHLSEDESRCSLSAQVGNAKVCAMRSTQWPRVQFQIAFACCRSRKRRRDSKQSASNFLGEINDVTAIYAAADIFVLPTLYDPFSNACLEALASGLPVITTRDNGFSEIIEDGIHGSIVDHAGRHRCITRRD